MKIQNQSDNVSNTFPANPIQNPRLTAAGFSRLSFLSCGEPPEEEVSPSDLVRSWTQVKANDSKDVSFDARRSHTTVVFKNDLWVIGGNTSSSSSGASPKNDVWKSPDGIKWERVTTTGTVAAGTFFPERYGHTAAVFKGTDANQDTLWIIAGEGSSGKLNDVWKSTDGIQWEKKTSITVFNDGSGDALWVIGGAGGSGLLNDLLKSTDGSTWEKVDPTGTVDTGTFFSPRSGHTAAAFDGALWVIGGDDFSLKNDVWKSKDGIKWEKVNADGSFTPTGESYCRGV
ncbi:hypothetical protein CHS0354_018411 [Potamilus streckersoni]|uniref:Galactose oxidase n=1 Tax=Potamilus streckersoni TaxID=2493646 RepID=A0AAE0TAJ5_9BIVA|nr:hypothetical protein CHS0354_018411 [Potamilus streckersoni]